jgi:hypothetical protein
MRDLSKALIDTDQKRKMNCKFKNTPHEAWKSKLSTVKQTPFGNFKGHKAASDFDFEPKQDMYQSDPASITVSKGPLIDSAEEGAGREESHRLRGQNGQQVGQTLHEASGAQLEGPRQERDPRVEGA